MSPPNVGRRLVRRSGRRLELIITIPQSVSSAGLRDPPRGAGLTWHHDKSGRYRPVSVSVSQKLALLLTELFLGQDALLPEFLELQERFVAVDRASRRIAALSPLVRFL